MRRQDELVTNSDAPTATAPQPLGRRLLAELLGTGLLVTVVVGSGIAAADLSPRDTGLQLLENSTATVLGLAVLILMLGPVSGAHFNPVVTVADWFLSRRDLEGFSARHIVPYVAAQSAGAVAGALLANAMFDVGTTFSEHERASGSHLLGEVVATAGLVLLIFALVRTDRTAVVAPAVGAYIGAAYWFTSSTSFANPAVALGRMFSDTFAGIAPTSVPSFVLAQIVGAAIGIVLVLALYPSQAVTPHTHQGEPHA
ncbi:aquaporin family protein [Aeromicrobium ginsengisoli]|uniref:Aquaporin family protein n=1 Tax=Aeromicrobium ginsengisoli TaxID=363867 RepID=A0A5M4FA29_9ACTN|nr:aquaporin family protein [Aeromicrobium ginsengisoli]